MLEQLRNTGLQPSGYTLNILLRGFAGLSLEAALAKPIENVPLLRVCQHLVCVRNRSECSLGRGLVGSLLHVSLTRIGNRA